MNQSPEPAEPLLDVQGLKTYFFTRDGVVRAVDGVSFSVGRGETLAIVGESGCGKSVTSLSILRLIASPPGRTVDGRVMFEGRDLLDLPEPEMRKIRGDAISMIFQEPMTSLNPVLTIGHLIAEEPTTALDVTIQAQILDLMRELKTRTGAAIMLITHDLGVVAEMAQRVVVMYAGRKVEEASVADLFARPRHPYTRGLLDSIPKLGAATQERRASDGAAGGRLAEIAGTVPSLLQPIVGCAFAPRCAYATERCRVDYPPLEEKARGHWAACWESERLVANEAADAQAMA